MITLISATYNGSHTLPRFLDALTKLENNEPWKLVIVDNASTDNTKQIIQSYSNKLPLTYLLETRKGKNIALNSALAHIEGDIVIFTDDDVIPSSDWLQKYREAFDAHPDYSIFGGAILPHWEAKPQLLHLEAIPQGPVYALTKPDWEDGPCSPYNIWGPNMAIRSSIFTDGHQFDENIGPSSQNKNYVMGSETCFTSHLVNNGHKCWHLPNVKVQHIIRKNQMQADWVFKRGIRYGRSLYEPADTGYNPMRLAGYPAYLIVRWVKALISLAASHLSLSLKRKYQAKWQLNVCIGTLIEAKTRHEQ